MYMEVGCGRTLTLVVNPYPMCVAAVGSGSGPFVALVRLGFSPFVALVRFWFGGSGVRPSWRFRV